VCCCTGLEVLERPRSPKLSPIQLVRRVIRCWVCRFRSGKLDFLIVFRLFRTLGALFFNLSPSNVEGKFTDKGGAAKLLHMVFTVAREPVMGPSVIYIDEAEKICANTGKKKVVNEGPARFKKDLPTYINSLTADDAVVVIGCSREPWLGEEKSFKYDASLFGVFPKRSCFCVGFMCAVVSMFVFAGSALNALCTSLIQATPLWCSCGWIWWSLL
jgi:hypothetical protein